MLLDQINLNYLRIFESVYRTRSMTKAAQELHLTQSGISQHIKSLEESLDLKLFDRIKQKLVPTDQGQVLYEDISTQLKNLEQALLTVTSRDQLLRGEVNIGAPVVFGLNKIIPLITYLGQTHPELKFSLHFDLAHAINNMLLGGELDFAFVDDFTMDTHVKTQKTYDEVLQLCCSEKYYEQACLAHGTTANKKFFEQLDYIAYEKGEPIIRKWLGFHVKGGQFQLNVKAYVADALGISHFIKTNLGVGVLPKHHVNELIGQGEKIHVFDTKGKDLKNKISVAYVSSRTRSRAVQESFDYILESLKGR